MNKLSEKEIEAIRKRAEKATEGWIAVDGVYVVSRDDDGNDIVIAECDTEDNAYFIGEARQDIPKLLAEIDRLNKIIEECGKDLGSIEGNILGTIGSFTHVSVRLSDIMDVKDKLEEAIGNERK